MIGTGARGEERAARFLLRRGWRILARNWRGGGGEIDIVARRLGTVVFVEVKTRVDPAALEEPLVAAQRRRLIRAAESWLARHPEHSAAAARFDVITVRGARGARAVRHLPGAFYIADAAVDAPSTSKRRSSGYATDRNDVR